MSFIVAFRASSEEIPLPVIPGLSSKPLDASNPHKQVCYEYFFDIKIATILLA